MPVKGQINARPNDYRIDNMKVGDFGYIEHDEIIVFRSCIMIDLFAPVILDEDDDDIADQGLIIIRKVGNGFTEDDYELDFTDSDPFDFVVESNSVYIQSMKESDRYIIFRDVNILIDSDNLSYESKQSKLDKLNERLKTALEEQDFLKAREVQNEINEYNLKNKK